MTIRPEPGEGHDQPPAPVDRLPHGYTNATSWSLDSDSDGTEDRRLVKHYLGPHATERRQVEATALIWLQDRFPVPYVQLEAAVELWLARLPGRPGQELLLLDPERVLAALGAVASRLHALSPPPGWSGSGVFIHGDFGPQNALLDPHTYAVTGVLDWELAHVGQPVEDLAWAEWIIRTHHPELTWALPALFAGYGKEPPWPERQAAMLGACRAALDFVVAWAGSGSPAAAVWRGRITATEGFSPTV